MGFGCEREKELTELLHRGHWPQACSSDLRAHVAQCRCCSDLVLIAASFQAMRRQASSAPPTVSSGALWWRAQLRRRNQAVDRIAKPITGAQLFAFPAVLFLAVAAMVWAATHGVNAVAWAEDLSRALQLSTLLPDPLRESVKSFWWVVPLATLALIGGVVVYFASEKE